MRLKTIRTSDQASKALFLMKVFYRFCLYAMLATTTSFPKTLRTVRNVNDLSYFITFIVRYLNSYVYRTYVLSSYLNNHYTHITPDDEPEI